MTNHIDLRHSYGNNQRLWVVSPDLAELLDQAPNVAEYNPSPNGFFTLSNEAIYLTLILRESMPERLYLKLKETMPRFEFSSESITRDGKSLRPVCDSIEVHCGTYGLRSYPSSGISDTLDILTGTETREFADHQMKGKPEWFELGTRLLETAIQKYHVDELYERYIAELPELKAQQECEKRERQEKSKPKGFLARLFS